MRCFQQSEVNVLILLGFKRAARHRFLCAASVFFRLRGHLVFFLLPLQLVAALAPAGPAEGGTFPDPHKAPGR